MSTFFGARWDAPIVDDATQIPTPVGWLCDRCEEPIEDGARGWVRPTLRGSLFGADPVATLVAIHMECELASVVGHMVGVCQCTGWPASRAEGREVLRRVDAGALRRGSWL